jgi:hypothetical protein
MPEYSMTFLFLEGRHLVEFSKFPDLFSLSPFPAFLYLYYPLTSTPHALNKFYSIYAIFKLIVKAN